MQAIVQKRKSRVCTAQPVCTYHRAFPEGQSAPRLIGFPIRKKLPHIPLGVPAVIKETASKLQEGPRNLLERLLFLPRTGYLSYQKKKRRGGGGGKQLSRFTSSFPESSTFIRFLRDPWKVRNKFNLPMLEQDGERDTWESAYASRNYFSPSLTLLHISWFLLYTVCILVPIFCAPRWMLSHLIPAGYVNVKRCHGVNYS